MTLLIKRERKKNWKWKSPTSEKSLPINVMSNKGIPKIKIHFQNHPSTMCYWKVNRISTLFFPFFFFFLHLQMLNGLRSPDGRFIYYSQMAWTLIKNPFITYIIITDSAIWMWHWNQKLIIKRTHIRFWYQTAGKSATVFNADVGCFMFYT